MTNLKRLTAILSLTAMLAGSYLFSVPSIAAEIHEGYPDIRISYEGGGFESLEEGEKVVKDFCFSQSGIGADPLIEGDTVENAIKRFNPVLYLDVVENERGVLYESYVYITDIFESKTLSLTDTLSPADNKLELKVLPEELEKLKDTYTISDNISKRIINDGIYSLNIKVVSKNVSDDEKYPIDKEIAPVWYLKPSEDIISLDSLKSAPEITMSKGKSSKTYCIAFASTHKADRYELKIADNKKFKKAKTVYADISKEFAFRTMPPLNHFDYQGLLRETVTADYQYRFLRESTPMVNYPAFIIKAKAGKDYYIRIRAIRTDHNIKSNYYTNKINTEQITTRPREL